MKGETLFLKLTVILLALPVIAACVFLLPWLIRDTMTSDWEYANLLYPILAAMYLSAIPFFIALYQTFRLLHYIDRNNAFSERSVRALRNIKRCAGAISGLYVLSMPFFFLVGDRDDAPGVVLIGMVLIFAPIVIAVFAAVLQKLLANAIEIKSENDLTV
ncbi:DUF2975 domain-containing protein [Indiicoccus explosivorum]|uniref:DUF2975 domain-containing protein n=1 Tax=Indiicoccus explosivorum TaxID=1917864 RepID=UPI000B453A3F|nr:DUF2975 domain-containing protein [Indiicoccus explosivorum]